MHTGSFRLCHVRVADLLPPLQILFAANTDTDCLVTTIQVNTVTSQETHGHDIHVTQIIRFLAKLTQMHAYVCCHNTVTQEKCLRLFGDPGLLLVLATLSS